MNDVHFKKIALIGIGLIGSSIAHAVKARRLADEVAISTRGPATLKRIRHPALEIRELAHGVASSVAALSRGPPCCQPCGPFGAARRSKR